MHDLPASPRRPSLLPPPSNHGSKVQKKPGAPKAKGSVRAKSGCYTCRIRRKKCDEAPDEEGRCSTCVRLRLQCLGFGQKRPEWLKENNNVTVFREKIKEFLAAQGMIKGHSGTGSRQGEAENTLILLPEHQRASSSSPPTTPASSSSDDHRPRAHAISDARDILHYPAVHHMSAQPSSYGGYSMPDLSPDVSVARDGGYLSQHGHGHELSLPISMSTVPHTPSTVAPPMPWPNNPSASYPVHPPPHSHPPPLAVAIPTHFTSTLSQSYHHQYPFEEEIDDYTEDQISPEYTAIPHSLSTNVFPQVSDAQNGLVQHYLAHVLKRQYLLADVSITEFIVQTIQKSQAVRDAACLLASLHQQSLQQQARLSAGGLVEYNEPTREDTSAYSRICLSLQLKDQRQYTEDEALTGLLVVSAFLFRGGRGAWQQFLNVATEWVWSVLAAYDYVDTADVLLSCTESQRFIIKTTFWFDILASTTRLQPLAAMSASDGGSRLQPPRFLEYYRRLWAPRRGAFIEGPGGAGGVHGHGHGPRGHGHGDRPELSMLTVMGCDNATALAIAEASNLAYWKDRQARAGALSMPTLVDRGRRIEAELLASASPTSARAPYPLGGEDELAVRRRLTANIFRATARVYLHAVVSGDYPAVAEIREGIAETIVCLQAVPTARSALSSSVLRSVVFGMCLCGCLTDDWEERRFILRRLEEEQEEGVGNCAEARRVMERVWERREVVAREGGPPVNWRDVMQELGGGESLLLV